jgi:hypothetical protein
MSWLRMLLVPLLFVLAASACHGDGGPATSPTPVTPTPSPTPAPTPSPTPTAVPSPTPTIIRVTPLDGHEFSERYREKWLVQRRCTFDVAAGQVDCGEDGLYQPDPPPAENAGCAILLLEDEPVALNCTVQEPLSVMYYEILQ